MEQLQLRGEVQSMVLLCRWNEEFPSSRVQVSKHHVRAHRIYRDMVLQLLMHIHLDHNRDNSSKGSRVRTSSSILDSAYQNATPYASLLREGASIRSSRIGFRTPSISGADLEETPL